MESVILNIPQIAESQNNKYITHNNAIDYVEQAMNAPLSKAVSGTSDVTLTDDECRRYRHYIVTSGTGNFNVVFKGQVNTNNTKREFTFHNQTAHTATVKSDDVGTTVVVASGVKAIIRQDTDNMLLVVANYGTTVPYDVGFSLTGLPEDGVEVFKFVAVRAIDFADDFAGSRGHCQVNPTATAAFDVLKNGSTIGSISISTGGTFTFSTTGGAVSLVAGDRLSVTSPSPQDATLSDVGIMFAGTRTL